MYNPSWVTNPKFTRVPVIFSDDSRSSLTRLVEAGKLHWYSKHESDQATAAIEQILSLDPRGVIHGRGNYDHAAKADVNKDASRQKSGKSGRVFCLRFDNLKISFVAGAKRELIVNQIHLCHPIEE